MTRYIALVLAATVCAALASAARAQTAPRQGPLDVATSMPATVLFGDRLLLHVVVLVDPDAVDANSVRVSAPVAPLTQLEAAEITRFKRGPLAGLAYALTAACFDQGCVSDSGERQLRLPPVRVEARLRDATAASVTKRWPVLVVQGRVARADVERAEPPFRVELDPPPASYRIRPALLAALLEAAAAMLAAAAVALALFRATRAIRARRQVTASELDRALALARSAGARAPADRRRALGLLARVLRPRGGRLAGDASDLAWSAPEPTPVSVSNLVDRVAHEVEDR